MSTARNILELTHTMVELSRLFKRAISKDLKKANKAISKQVGELAKSLLSKVTGKLWIEVYNDAVFWNLKDHILIGYGHIFCLAEEGNCKATLGWNSIKVGVMGSTGAVCRRPYPMEYS